MPKVERRERIIEKYRLENTKTRVGTSEARQLAGTFVCRMET